MNVSRIRRDIEKAQQQFDFVEGHPTSSGGIMVLVALQTVRHYYTLAVIFPEAYPNSMPDVFVRKPTLEASPHRYKEAGQICYMHPRMWNPGRHDLTFVIQRAAKWLSKYEVYRTRGRWPGAGIDH